MLEQKELEEKMLSEEELDQVNGGDNGDYKKEWAKTPEDIKPLYQVGQVVEVYTTVFHVTTYTAEIIFRSAYVNSEGYFIPKYTVKNLKSGDIEQVTSSHIQSS